MLYIYIHACILFRDKIYKKYAKLGQIGDRHKLGGIENQKEEDNENVDETQQPKYKPKTEIRKDRALKKEQFVDYEGYRFPVKLDNPWAVAKVLNQSKGKMSIKELKSMSTNKNNIKISAQAKVSLRVRIKK